MAHSIKTVYVVHHSHTDIGYTDLQERVIAIQVNYIKTVLSMMRQPEYADFRWNCETLYCVEESRMFTATTVCIRCTRTRMLSSGKTLPDSGCWSGTANIIIWAMCWGFSPTTLSTG